MIAASSNPVQVTVNSTANPIITAVPIITAPQNTQNTNSSSGTTYLVASTIDVNALPATAAGGSNALPSTAPLPGAVEQVQQIPLTRINSLPEAIYVNVNSGQEMIISAQSVPSEGVYVSKQDSTSIVVITSDANTGEKVIMQGSSGGSAITIGAKTKLTKPAVCS